MFSYDEFTTRNIGFVSYEEQALIRKSKVFIAGIGGMGGVALGCLARTGVEHFIIADLDTFEISNLNRQIFANLDSIDQGKVEASIEAVKKINPNITIENYGIEWTQHLDTILPKVDIVINGCDDTLATIILMRQAKLHNKTVIDAFASPLPSVYTVTPTDPRPESYFNFPTNGKNLENIKEDDIENCALKEIIYVMANSSSVNHVVLKHAQEMMNGERKRISLAPMVWMTGCLMSYEVLKVILSRKKLASHKGIFINPWTFKIEKPANFLWRTIKTYFVKKYIKSLLG